MTATITRTYDGLDRLTNETTAQGSVTYTYDNASRRATMTVAGQPQVTYTYDNANRLTQIQQGTATAALTHDDADRRTSVTLPTGTSITYTYDAASQLTLLTYKQGATTLGTLTYTYDRAGNRTAQGGTFARGSITLAVPSATYNVNNQQTVFAATTLAYDLNGNLTTATDASGAATYTWNARNQLTAITAPAFTASFAYDALGRRTTKVINGFPTQYLYDGLNVVQEKNGAAVTANLLMGLGIDEVLTRTDGAGTRGFLTDALGSTIALVDNTGAVLMQYTYEPFGAVNHIGAASQNSYTFTGREDDGSGLYYYRARYYHPRLQRFISEDPMGFAGGLNKSAYALNNPTKFVDPKGLQSEFFVPSPPSLSTNQYMMDRPYGMSVCKGGSIWYSINPFSLNDQEDQRCGKIGCLQSHELVHVADIYAANPRVCRNAPDDAVIFANGDAVRRALEVRGYTVERDCLMGLLRNPPCGCERRLTDRLLQTQAGITANQ